MAGIASLAPGQAQQGPMPGMMPKPQGVQPGVPALVPSLVGMDMGQLLQMFADPNNPVPKNRLLAAMTEKQKEMAARQAVQGQMAMSQAQQQPGTVKDQVVQGAMQAAQPAQMAAHGGIMQGYAGGGAVAFQTAGAIPPGLLNPDVDEDGLPRGKDEREQIIDYNNKVRAAYEQQMKSKAAAGPRTAAPSMQDIAGMMAGRRQLEQFYKPRDPEAYTPERVGFKVGDIAPGVDTPVTRQGKSGIADLDIGPLMSPVVRGAAPAPGPSASPGGQRQAATAPEQAMGAPTMKLPDLPPERRAKFDAYNKKAEELARSQAALAEQLGKVSPEVLAARERLQQVLGSAYDPQKKALEEAKAAQSQGLLGNAEALGRMAAAMGGAKRFGQGLAAAAGAGSQFVGEQRKRIEDLQDKYNSLKSQLDITMAQAVHADAIGDDKLKRDALTKAEAIKTDLFNTQRGIDKEAFGEQVQQAQGIAALQQAAAQKEKARADIIQAGKPSELQQREALYRRDPNAYEAMFGPKESAAVANLVRAVNSDPLLKNLAEMAKLDSNAEGRYNARYKELVATHAPQLLLGAGGGGGSASSGARAAADKILSGG